MMQKLDDMYKQENEIVTKARKLKLEWEQIKDDIQVMEQLIISGTNGLVIIRDAGEHAVLVGIARADAKLGLVLLDMKRAAVKLEKMI